MNIVTLKTKFDRYYNTDFDTEESDSANNFALRKEALTFFEKAKKSGDNELAENVIELLANHTGCVEDLEFFEQLSEPLIENGLLTTEQYKKVTFSRVLFLWS